MITERPHTELPILTGTRQEMINKGLNSLQATSEVADEHQDHDNPVSYITLDTPSKFGPEMIEPGIAANMVQQALVYASLGGFRDKHPNPRIQAIKPIAVREGGVSTYTFFVYNEQFGGYVDGAALQPSDVISDRIVVTEKPDETLPLHTFAYGVSVESTHTLQYLGVSEEQQLQLRRDAVNAQVEWMSMTQIANKNRQLLNPVDEEDDHDE